MSTTIEPRWLNLRDAGEYMGGRSADVVMAMIRCGQLSYVRLGRQWIVDRQDIDRIAKDGQRLSEIGLRLIERAAEAGRTLYFIASKKTVKIGITGNVEKRLDALQHASALQLRLVAVARGDRATEKALHRLFAEQRMRGEWFRLEGELKVLIDRIQKQAEESRYE